MLHVFATLADVSDRSGMIFSEAENTRLRVASRVASMLQGEDLRHVFVGVGQRESSWTNVERTPLSLLRTLGEENPTPVTRKLLGGGRGRVLGYLGYVGFLGFLLFPFFAFFVFFKLQPNSLRYVVAVTNQDIVVVAAHLYSGARPQSITTRLPREIHFAPEEIDGFFYRFVRFFFRRHSYRILAGTPYEMFVDQQYVDEVRAADAALAVTEHSLSESHPHITAHIERFQAT